MAFHFIAVAQLAFILFALIHTVVVVSVAECADPALALALRIWLLS